MTGPVNPILVVKTNLPDYKAELLKRRLQHVSVLAAIDDELIILERLEAAVYGATTPAVPADSGQSPRP